MSERFKSGLQYLDSQFQFEFDRYYQEFQRLPLFVGNYDDRYLAMERDYYRNRSRAKALSLAIEAFEHGLKRNKGNKGEIMFKDDDKLPAESTGSFLKLQDKESVRGVFRGVPYDYAQHFNQTENKSYTCEGPNCGYCKKEEKKPSFRFKMNFVTKDADGKLTAKIFESGVSVYKQLRELDKQYSGLTKVIVTVTRNGVKKNTTYSILPVPNWQVDAKFEEMLKGVQLHELMAQPQQAQVAAPEPGSFDEDIPF